MRKSIKLTAAIGSAALVLTTAGVAYAYWTTTGDGTGSAATTAGVTGTLEFDQTALDEMYPGDPEQDLVVSITNSSPTEKVYVTTVKAYLEVTPVVAGTCDSTDFLLNGLAAGDDVASAATLTWTSQELDAAELEAHDATGTIQFNDKATNQDGCKSASVTVHYDAV